MFSRWRKSEHRSTMMVSKHLPTEEESITSDDENIGRVLSLDDDGEDEFVEINSLQAKALREDSNCQNLRRNPRHKSDTAIDRISHTIREVDYEKHFASAKKQLHQHAVAGAIAGLKLTNHGVKLASQTINDFTDSVVASREIARVRRDGDGRIQPLGCDYVGGKGVDAEMSRETTELLDNHSDNNSPSQPSPSSATVAIISERVNELPTMACAARGETASESQAKSHFCDVRSASSASSPASLSVALNAPDQIRRSEIKGEQKGKKRTTVEKRLAVDTKRAPIREKHAHTGEQRQGDGDMYNIPL